MTVTPGLVSQAARERGRIVVVGAGPVGLTAAVSLARIGIAVTVLEAGQGLSNESRASTFHPSSLEILSELEVADRALAAGLIVESIQFRNGPSNPIAELDYRVLASETRFPYRLQLEQSKMTPLLLDRLRAIAQPDIRFGHRVEEVEQSESGVVVRAETASGVAAIEADYVIGADGAGSSVRRALGVEFSGSTYPERFLVLSTTYDFKSMWPDLAYVNYVSHPKNWFALLRTPDHWRLTIPIRTDAEEQLLGKIPELQDKARQVLGVEIEPPIVHSNIYRVHRRVADRFVAGRCVLIGDAAHVNNPTGGLGMNSGIIDAYFLAPALAATLAGDRQALSRYGEQQRHIALDVVGHYSNSTWVALSQTDEQARQRWAAELKQLASDRAQVFAYLKEISLLNVLAGLHAAVAG